MPEAKKNSAIEAWVDDHSHGTLGLLVAIELRVIPAPTHVRLVYRPFFDLQAYCTEHQRLLHAERPPWFLDGQVFGLNRAVIIEVSPSARYLRDLSAARLPMSLHGPRRHGATTGPTWRPMGRRAAQRRVGA